MWSLSLTLCLVVTTELLRLCSVQIAFSVIMPAEGCCGSYCLIVSKRNGVWNFVTLNVLLNSFIMYNI
jgi:hypothetical protein